jgi:hypothetical protein
MNEYDKQHLRNISRIERMVEALFQAAATDAANLSTIIGDLGDVAFSWDDYPLALAKINDIVARLKSEVEVAIVNGVRSEWTLSNNKNNELCRQVFGSLATSLPAHIARRYFSTNESARDAFLVRRENGLNLSDNVWRYTNQFKGEIEMALDIGIRSGRSADEISRDVREYLKEPHKLFRRVRDEHGQLQLSKNAAAYHPGRGVYRSSYMNARRLAATETNIAYRTADHLRWQQLDFVVGIEIHLSNNHNCKGVPAGMFFDICDDLKGKYPKDFQFTGWHPHCRCYATSILKSDKELEADNERIMAGENVSVGSVNEVSDIPDNFKEWVENNKERAKGWETMPYFVKDNDKYTRGFEVDTYDQPERKFTRSRKTKDAMFTAVKELSIRYPEIPNTELGAIYHFSRGDVSAFRQLNNQLRKGNVNEFNEAFATLMERGLDKIDPITATTYRTMRLNKTNLQEWLRMAVGNREPVTEFKGFTSSSLDRSIAENFAEQHTGRKKNETDVLLVIRGKSGRPIEGLSQYGLLDNGKPNQREVIFNRGKKFRVLSYRKLENGACGYEFEIEEI